MPLASWGPTTEPAEVPTIRSAVATSTPCAASPFPSDLVECTSIVTLRDLLHASDMITAVPMFVAKQDPPLRSLPTDLSSIRRSVGVMLDAERPLAPAAALLIRHLTDEATAMAAESGEQD